jgi:predicted transcriptional regulator of viral defense system
MVSADAVVSHVSAAALHGLTMWDVDLRRVHVTVSRPSGGRRTRLLHVHPATLDPDQLTQVDGLACTTIAQTVVDVARTLPFEHALVVADAARHRHRVSAAQLAAAVERVAGRRGRHCGTSG